LKVVIAGFFMGSIINGIKRQNDNKFTRRYILQTLQLILIEKKAIRI